MRIILSQNTLPAFNLATEEYLFTLKGESFFLLYRNDPSVIIGSNQAVVNEVNQDFCIEHGIRILRRMSGGGAVFHDHGNLNYSLIYDKTQTPLSAQFLEPIVEVLELLKIPVEVGRRKDLWMIGRKISGTASHVSTQRELHHGTLLYDTDLDMLERALTPELKNPIKKATASVPSPVMNIRSYLAEKGMNPPNILTFISQVSSQLLTYYGEKDLTSLPIEAYQHIERLLKEKYTSRSWNYRL